MKYNYAEGVDDALWALIARCDKNRDNLKRELEALTLDELVAFAANVDYAAGFVRLPYCCEHQF